MAIDLKQYAGDGLPTYENGKSYNTKEDYEKIQEFNKKMDEICHDYSTKEKQSYISAKKIVLTDHIY